MKENVNRQRRFFMDKRGVTLIELLIVVAIIGILAMIAVPAYIGQQKAAARTEAYSNLDNLRLLEEQYFAENGCYYKSGANCANSNITGVSNIQAFLPGFKPGNEASVNFSYNLSVYTTSGSTAAAFRGTATGKSGTRVSGDTFWIDSNNNRNF
jgi:prepilin-type N-terminal cleavage/methylation domain-containing protein